MPCPNQEKQIMIGLSPLFHNIVDIIIIFILKRYGNSILTKSHSNDATYRAIIKPSILFLIQVGAMGILINI